MKSVIKRLQQHLSKPQVCKHIVDSVFAVILVDFCWLILGILVLLNIESRSGVIRGLDSMKERNDFFMVREWQFPGSLSERPTRERSLCYTPFTVSGQVYFVLFVPE